MNSPITNISKISALIVQNQLEEKSCKFELTISKGTIYITAKRSGEVVLNIVEELLIFCDATKTAKLISDLINIAEQ